MPVPVLHRHINFRTDDQWGVHRPSTGTARGSEARRTTESTGRLAVGLPACGLNNRGSRVSFVSVMDSMDLQFNLEEIDGMTDQQPLSDDFDDSSDDEEEEEEEGDEAYDEEVEVMEEEDDDEDEEDICPKKKRGIFLLINAAPAPK